MSRHKFPASLPRKLHWSDEIGGYASCPDCGAPLEAEHHAYVLVTRRGGDMDFHLVGNAAGHFCEKCPLVVLDRERFEDFVALAVGPEDRVKYVVMGIVDFEAVPEDKKSLPFDDDTNPVPLVEFTNVGGRKRSSSSPTRQPNRGRSAGSTRRKRKNRKKKRRR